jgi:hypothetical protein
MTRKGWLGALVALISINLLTFLTPIELYDGVAELKSGEFYKEKLSLNYLINQQAFLDRPENEGIQSLRLNFIGYVLFTIINIGLPLLLGYRWSIAETKKKLGQDE